jgi:leucine-rich PPR motif-containing protein
MIKGYCKYGQLEQAMETFDKLKSLEIKTDEVLYNSLLDGCSKNKNLTKAFEVFEIMQKDPNCQPTTVSYNSLIDACVRTSSLSKAWELLA